MPECEEARRRRLATAATLVEPSLDGVLVTDLINVRHLSAFTGSSAALLLLAGGTARLATDARYALQAASECPDVDVTITRNGAPELLAAAGAHGAVRVGYEDRALSVRDHRELTSITDDLSITLVPVGTLVDQGRLVKDEQELRLLAEACAVSDQALALVLPQIRVGVSEREIARRLDDAMRDITPEGPGFDTIVAAGANSAIPHHTPTEQTVARGDFVKMDFGARVGGYHADMTRTVLLGEPSGEWQPEIYGVAAAAQLAGREALSATATGVEVDRAARRVVEAAGWGDSFTHGLGHGVGLQIHEAPFLGSTSTDRLAAAVPVTVEPGIYLPGRGGVRIEDTVVVHHDRVELLTTSTRELLVLD